MGGDQANGKAWVGVVLVGDEDHDFAITESDRHGEPGEARREASGDAMAEAEAERVALRRVDRNG